MASMFTPEKLNVLKLSLAAYPLKQAYLQALKVLR